MVCAAHDNDSLQQWTDAVPASPSWRAHQLPTMPMSDQASIVQPDSGALPCAHHSATTPSRSAREQHSSCQDGRPECRGATVPSVSVSTASALQRPASRRACDDCSSSASRAGQAEPSGGRAGYASESAHCRAPAEQVTDVHASGTQLPHVVQHGELSVTGELLTERRPEAQPAMEVELSDLTELEACLQEHGMSPLQVCLRSG